MGWRTHSTSPWRAPWSVTRFSGSTTPSAWRRSETRNNLHELTVFRNKILRNVARALLIRGLCLRHHQTRVAGTSDGARSSPAPHALVTPVRLDDGPP